MDTNTTPEPTAFSFHVVSFDTDLAPLSAFVSTTRAMADAGFVFVYHPYHEWKEALVLLFANWEMTADDAQSLFDKWELEEEGE